MANIDKVDTELLELLQENGRTSQHDLARAVRLSAPAVAERLLVLLGAAESDVRPPARLVRSEAGLADQPVRLHVDVEAEFAVHAGLGGAAAEQEAQARARGLEPAHEVRSTVSSPAAKRRQLCTSCARPRRPAAVSR